MVDRLLARNAAANARGDDEADDDGSARKRIVLLERKARYLFKAGSAQDALPLFEEVERYYLRQAEVKPGDAAASSKLATLYASKPFGENYEKAYKALDQAVSCICMGSAGTQRAGQSFPKPDSAVNGAFRPRQTSSFRQGLPHTKPDTRKPRCPCCGRPSGGIRGTHGPERPRS
jgi:hypothetical protein